MGKNKNNFERSSESEAPKEEIKKEVKKSTAVPPKMVRLPNGSFAQVNK